MGNRFSAAATARARSASLSTFSPRAWSMISSATPAAINSQLTRSRKSAPGLRKKIAGARVIAVAERADRRDVCQEWIAVPTRANAKSNVFEPGIGPEQQTRKCAQLRGGEHGPQQLRRSRRW